MKTSLVHPSKSLGYSDIYLDFVAGNDPPRNFYFADNLGSVAAKLDGVKFDRERMAAILETQNTTYGASATTFDNIAKLTDPKTVCVLSGQQAGFLGGPLFSIIKAVSIVQAAEKYSKDLGRPVIPIFWIAGDDHDFEEANHAWVINREQGCPCKIAYTTPPEFDVSTASVTFSDEKELEQAKHQLKACLGDTDFTPALYDLIDRSYTPQDTLATAFGKMMSGLMRDTGLILFCPGDNEVKRHAVPFFKRILDRQDELHALISQTNDEIMRLGYHIQVEKSDNAAHLFYELDGRKPVLRDGDLFTVGEKVFTRGQLDTCIESHPEKFSTDVMTRPVIQSYFFPTVSQKGGPAEVAYLAQINPIFELFDLPAPVHMARSTATIVETRFEKLMNDYEISFEDLTGDIEQVINRVLARSFPQELKQHFTELKDDVEVRFKKFMDESLEFDPSLQKFAEQIYGKIDYNLKGFESKVFSSHKKKSKQVRDRIYKLYNVMYTNRGFQERSLNVSYFVSRYGFDFVSFLFEQMDSEEKAHQLLYLSEMQS